MELTAKRSKAGRPPRGGRGLKYVGRVVAVEGSTVAPLAGGVD